MSGQGNASSMEVVKAARTGTELLGLRNRVAVLKALRRHGRLSHTEISDHTGLASATVSAITADLERGRIIEKSEHAQSGAGRGRPRVQFVQRRDCAYLVTVIISSDAVQYSLVDYGGTLIDRFSEQRGPGGAAVFISAIRNGLERVLERSRVPRDKVLCISISSKGLVAGDVPVLRWSPVLGHEEIDFNAVLKPLWPARLFLSNETLLVAGALGQMAQAAGDFAGLAALSLGHSIGLGLAISRADREMDVTSPNFGHMLHVPNGALCRCGARGCVEAYTGLYAILRAAFEVPLDAIPAKFVPLAEVDKLAASARQGQRMAKHAFREAGLALGFGLSRVFSISGHLPVVVTGPGARHFDLMRSGMEEGLSQSQIVRMEGLPAISVSSDEPQLVFQGHLERAMAAMDEDIVMAAS